MVSNFPAAMLAAIHLAYRTPPRAYHAWAHVEDVEQWFQWVDAKRGWKQPREVFLAVLLHDAIYEPGAKDNEARSADLALAMIAQHLKGQGVDAPRVAELIRLTAKHGSLTPQDVDLDAAHFLDCDMAILGSAPEVFDAYGAAIRQEYAAVPDDLYAAGRRRFLEKVLAAPRIFLSDLFHARLDAAARANLRRALATPVLSGRSESRADDDVVRAEPKK